MKISELAKKAGCDVETIRYYEKAGLLEAPSRRDNGYREYAPRHLECLQFIRHCRSLQIALPEIRILLDLKSHPSSGCEEVNELLDKHISRTREKIAQLRSLESQLSSLRQQCQAPQSVMQCGILQNLNEPTNEHECACHRERAHE